MEPDQAVHQTACEEGRSDAATALDQDAGDAARAERRKGRAQVGIAVLVGVDLDKRDAAVAIGVPARRRLARRGRKSHHPRGRAARAGHQLVGQRQAQASVHHHPHRRTVDEPRQAARQLRIVLHRRGRPHQHRIVARPQSVGHPPRGLAGYPPAFRGVRGNASVERGGELQRHQRPAVAHAQDKTRVEFGGLGLARTDIGIDTRRDQPPEAAAVDAGIGIAQRDDRPCDAGSTNASAHGDGSP